MSDSLLTVSSLGIISASKLLIYVFIACCHLIIQYTGISFKAIIIVMENLLYTLLINHYFNLIVVYMAGPIQVPIAVTACPHGFF